MGHPVMSRKFGLVILCERQNINRASRDILFKLHFQFRHTDFGGAQTFALAGFFHL